MKCQTRNSHRESIVDAKTKIDHNWRENAIGEFEVDAPDLDTRNKDVVTSLRTPPQAIKRQTPFKFNRINVVTPRLSKKTVKILVGRCTLDVTYKYRSPPHRNRSRPVCLFVNYLGSRLPHRRSPYHRVHKIKKSTVKIVKASEISPLLTPKRRKNQRVASFAYFPKCGSTPLRASKVVFPEQQLSV